MSIINKHSPTWFANPRIMSSRYITELDNKIYTQSFIENNTVIKTHHRKYINDRYAPAWKTLEFFTFGAIFKTFNEIIDNRSKRQISSVYNITGMSVFENYMKTIIHIRNKCAHGGVLFDYKLPKSIKNGPALITTNDNKNSLFSAIIVINFILGKVSLNRKEDMKQEVITLLEQYKNHSVIKEIIENCSGYTFEIE